MTTSKNHRKVPTNTPRMPFSSPGSVFFGFRMLSSCFWPDSRPISPNLGRFRAIFLFRGVIVSFHVRKLHVFVHLRQLALASSSEPRLSWLDQPQAISSRHQAVPGGLACSRCGLPVRADRRRATAGSQCSAWEPSLGLETTF